MFGPEEMAAAASWAYAGLALVTLLDVFVPVLPAETSVITGGVLAAAGHAEVTLVVALAVAGAWTGDALAYRAGRVLGRRRGRRQGPRRESAVLRRLRRALTARQGGVLVVARFVPGGRTVVSFAAGAMRFPAGRFLRLTLLASALWATWATTLGYVGGQVFGDRLWLAVVVSKSTAAGLLGLSELVRRGVTARARRERTRGSVPAPEPARSGGAPGSRAGRIASPADVVGTAGRP
ncbi:MULTISPECIES: VTT domain-containing protein [unclassified Streptomyces]|uniref:DedA family protein n=1 Tax=unclassified Streptomyces TaxID=2593676 RepID=UPI0036E41FE7